MTEYEAYQEHIRYTHDTYCRIVICHASFDAARMLAARWVREISLEYLTEEKFVPLSTTDAGGSLFVLLTALDTERNQKTIRLDTQHNRAAYPACFETAESLIKATTLNLYNSAIRFFYRNVFDSNLKNFIQAI